MSFKNKVDADIGFHLVLNINVKKTVLNFLYGPPKIPMEITKRKEADKAFVKAVKVAIKAGNHYANASKALISQPINDEYVTQQIFKAELREKTCVTLIGSVREFFEKKPKLKANKSKLLNDMLERLSVEMQELEIKINEIKTSRNIKN